MVKHVLITGCIILALRFGYYAWREHKQDQARKQAIIRRYAPALNSLSTQKIIGSDWSYSGPLGNLTLRFEQNGKILVVSDLNRPAGRWVINSNMLSLYLPGSTDWHQGYFIRSIDEVAGTSPHGMNPPTWSATRIRSSE